MLQVPDSIFVSVADITPVLGKSVQKWVTPGSKCFCLFLLNTTKKKKKNTCLFINRRSNKTLGFLGGSAVKNPPAKVGDAGSIPGSGRCPGEGNGNPLWYSCLGKPMDRWGRKGVGHNLATKQHIKLDLHYFPQVLQFLLWSDV